VTNISLPQAAEFHFIVRVPAIGAGKVRRKHPVEVDDVKFLRVNTTHAIKITVPGPFTMSQQSGSHHSASKTRINARMARPGHALPYFRRAG
jgi:methionine synthase II (cobalamin-independent)